MKSHLSPLNFSGLLAQAGVTPMDRPPVAARRNRAIECWKCSECFSVYEWEDEAEDCCAVKQAAGADSNANCCPICAKSAESARDAADCCLWKDLDQPTRYAAADQVEAGSTWLAALGFDHTGVKA